MTMVAMPGFSAASSAAPAVFRPDFAGAHYIKGRVFIQGQLARSEVHLLRRYDKLPMRAVFSDPGTGEYRFDWVPNVECTVASWDRDRVHNAAVKDLVIPLPMPE